MGHRQYSVYIMASPSRTLYVGVTNSLERRVLEHKSNENMSFSSKYHTSKLVHFETFSEINRAIAREKEIKGWRRSRKIWLVELENPRWQDLAEYLDAQL